MVQINFATREVSVKIVYYGPGRSGKTTNLQKIFEKAPPDSKGELISIATETDRTLYFDFLPLDLGKIAGMTTKFQLYTVPGQVYYNATRKLVLQGADGVIFVADSQRKLKDENEESLENLEENLEENGLDINEIPLVFQWNKRDLPDIMSPEELNADLNRWNAPTSEGVAVSGEGVFKTLKLLASLVIKKLNREHGFAEDGGARLAAGAPSAAPSAPVAAPKQPAAPTASGPVRLAGAAPSAPGAQRPAAAPQAATPAKAVGQPPAARAVPAQAAQPVGAPAGAPAGPARPGAAPAVGVGGRGRGNPLSLEIQRRKEAMARQRAQRPAEPAKQVLARPQPRKKSRAGLVILVILLLLLLLGGATVAYAQFVLGIKILPI